MLYRVNALFAHGDLPFRPARNADGNPLIGQCGRSSTKRHALCLLNEITETIARDYIEFPLRMENRANPLIRIKELAAALAVLEKYSPLADHYYWHTGVWEQARGRAYAALGDRSSGAITLPRARATLLPRGATQYGAELDGIAAIDVHFYRELNPVSVGNCVAERPLDEGVLKA